jgi:hypothetical protein
MGERYGNGGRRFGKLAATTGSGSEFAQFFSSVRR